jgi:phage-related protein|nr:MAG TPA: minor tail protein [Caudoviricetes sp.]
MAEIDDLTVKVNADAKQADSALEKLVSQLETVNKALGKIMSGNAFSDMAESAKAASASMQDISTSTKRVSDEIGSQMKKASNSIKGVETPVKETFKSIEDVLEKLGQKSIDIKPEIDVGNLSSEQKKYTEQLKNMQNGINRVLNSAHPEKKIGTLDSLVVKLNEAKNALKEIENLQGSVSTSTSEIPEPHFYWEDTRDPKDIIEDYKSSLERWKSYLENFNQGNYNAPTIGFVETIERSIEELKAEFPDAKSLIDEYEKIFEDLSAVAVPSVETSNVEIENPIKNIENEVDNFQKTIDSIKPLEFTGNFYEMEKWVDDLNTKLISLLDKREKLTDLGANMDTQRIHSMTYDIEQLSKTIEKYEVKVEEARKAGQLDIKIPGIDESLSKTELSAQKSATKIVEIFKNNKIIVQTDGFKKVQNEIQKVKKQYEELVKSIQLKSQTISFYGASSDFKKKQAELAALREDYQRLINKQKEMSILRFDSKGFTDGLAKLQGFVSKTSNTLGRINKKINEFGKKLLSLVAPTQKARAALRGLDITNASLAKSLLRTTKMLKLMIVRMALRGVIDGVKTGMQNLAMYSDETNASLSLLMNSLNQLKNSFAAAVAPILNAFAPALDKIIQLCIKAVNAINQVISTLLGNGTWIRAKKLTDNYRDSIGGAASEAKELNKQLQGFDKLNNLTTSKSGGGGGGASTTAPEDMFETVDIEDKWKDLADKIKSILSKIFDPLKEAWKRAGDFVMKSWKFALEEVWKLIKSIAKDFLEVWNEEATIQILENILYIIGDIGQVIGYLAQGFREAWEENDTGLQILQNIRDIIGAIVENILHAADATVEWAQNLDFSPLLTKIEEWTESLVPVFDSLSGIVTDFYETVLLPLAKWTLEQGLPDLLQVFIDFNEKVDWEKLRTNLKTLWEHVEPFAETIGEGLIIFVRDISDALANFINSQEFEDFLTKIEEWMDNVSAEDVANTLKDIAAGIIVLKTATATFSALSPAIEVIKSLVSVLSGIKMAKALKNLAKLGGGGATASASTGGLFSSFGGLGGLLTMDLGTIFGAGTFGEIAATIGVGATGAIAAWFAGNWTGKQLGALLFPDMKEEYLNFHWLGEGGFFDELFDKVDFSSFDSIKDKFKELTDAWDMMKSDFKDNPIIAVLANIVDVALRIGNPIYSVVTTLMKIPEAFNKIKEVFEEVVSFIKEKWELIKTGVSETLESWKTKFSETWENIKASAQGFVDSIKEKWESIKEAFTELKDNIIEKYESFKESISTGLSDVQKAWENAWSAIGENVGSVIKSISDSVSGAVSWIKDLLDNIDKIPETINIGVKTGLEVGKSAVKKVFGYASGGFIEPATYFKAGENGVPEILGTVGGKSAVAGGQEITGISNAIYSTGQTEAQLLSSAVQFLQIIANKDFSINSSDAFNAIREEAHSYEKRTGDKAFT